MKRILTLAALALLACDDAPPPASEAVAPDDPIAPSFDCTDPASSAEELICSDSDLAQLDLRMDSVFQLAIQIEESLPDLDAAGLRAFQRGWIGGRDECWKSDDLRSCVESQYLDRIVELQARYMMVPAAPPTFWMCEGEPANEFVTTLMETDLATVRVERGDQTEIGIQRPAASGSRYQLPFGREFWMRGQEARVVWPEGTELNCQVRPSG